MLKNKTFYFFALGLGVILLIIYSSITQPGIGSLEGDFKEVAFYRNENNTGPITRIYAVSVEDTLWGEMKKYGEFMPHNKYGTTKVYFFLATNPIPRQLVPGQENFKEKFNRYCLAKYEKDVMGKVSFLKHPENASNNLPRRYEQ